MTLHLLETTLHNLTDVEVVASHAGRECSDNITLVLNSRYVSAHLSVPKAELRHVNKAWATNIYTEVC